MSMQKHRIQEVTQILQQLPLFVGKEIQKVEATKLGMTNDSYLFQVEGKPYIFRYPGKGSDKIVNRHQEAAVYKALQGSGFAEDVIYFDCESGRKVSRFITDSHVCNPRDKKEVKRCLARLRDLHHLQLQVGHSFSLRQEIEKYESYLQHGSRYEDYAVTREKVMSLFPFVEANKKAACLCHIDAVSDNFLLTKEAVHLVDWEYAAMQDPDVDVAMFILYSGYSEEDTEEIISFFMEEEDKKRRYKIYAYLAIAGLLWSNWCEFKMQNGDKFGDYALWQYRFARDYSKKVREYLCLE